MDTQKQSKQKQQNRKKEEQQSLIYIGPTVKRGLLTKHTVYKNGLPKNIDEHLQKCPQLNRMFVDVTKMTEFENEVNDKTSSMHVFFNAVKTYFENEVK